ncbi:MAG: hypothetical protein ABTD50_09570 [Polyangiaceae bacterium]|jgi:hypothetical protein
MNRIAQLMSSSLLAVAACGGTVAERDGSDAGAGAYRLDASIPVSDATLDPLVDAIGQTCDVGLLCSNGVACVTGACQAGNCRSGADCVLAACSHGWCVTDNEYGQFVVPSITECLENPDAEFVCGEVTPIDAGWITGCQSYPDAGVVCAVGGADGGAPIAYCRALPNLGACVTMGSALPAEQ